MSSRVGRGRIKQLTSGVNPLVRFIHEHNEMTYRDLAKRSGLHATTIQRWRNAGMEPSLGDIERERAEYDRTKMGSGAVGR